MKQILTMLIPTSVKKKLKQKMYESFGFLNVTKPYEIAIKDTGLIKDKVAVVTGGSGALGRAICNQLAAEGAKVYVCGTNEHKVEYVVNEIVTNGGTAIPCLLNVKSETDINTKFQSIVEKEGRIDILVTCAGGSSRDKCKPIVEQDVEVIDEVLSINLRGTILCTRTAGKQMVLQGSGKIVVLSSTIGVQGKINFSEYAAAKGGVIAYSKSLAMELGKNNINVNCVSPGIIQRDKIRINQMDRLKGTNYLNSFGTPEDISNMVTFLVSDKAAFITGQNVVVDGGRSLGLKGD